jgi:hypothetical protein
LDFLTEFISLVGFCFMAVTVYSVVVLRLKTRAEIESDLNSDNYDDALAKADISALNRAQRRARAKSIMKQHRLAAQHQPVRHIGDGGAVHDDDNGNVENEQQLVLANGDIDAVHMLPADSTFGENRNLSRKERQRVAKLTEKKERHVFDDTHRKQQQEAEIQAKKEKLGRLKQKALQQDELRMHQKIQKQQQEMSCVQMTLIRMIQTLNLFLLFSKRPQEEIIEIIYIF